MVNDESVGLWVRKVEPEVEGKMTKLLNGAFRGICVLLMSGGPLLSKWSELAPYAGDK